jgi:hypothetical protein
MLPRWLPMIHSRGGVLFAALLLGACQQGAGLTNIVSGGLSASAPPAPEAAEITAARTQGAAEKPAAETLPAPKEVPEKPLVKKPLAEALTDRAAKTAEPATEPAARDLAMLTPPPRLAVPQPLPEPEPDSQQAAEPARPDKPELAKPARQETPPEQPVPTEPPGKKPDQQSAAEQTQIATAKPVPPPPLFNPDRAVGWSAEGLIAEIGAADFIRAEGAMRVWQYRSSYCVADFFFYPQAGQVELLILRGWHIRPTDVGAALSEKTCFEELGRRL